MAIRLIECRRVLKPTGGIYLHCDPTMSHYLKLVMDCIFGEKQFRNEIVWHYRSGGGGTKQFPKKHDVIFYYSKSSRRVFKGQDVGIVRGRKRRNNMKRGVSEDGRVFYSIKSAGKIYKYFEDEKMIPPDVWTDISHLQQKDPERTGYPTQKPLELLSRIIKASSNEGEVVLDPFCGCATTCVAAEAAGRQWIGIDISHKAYDLVKERITETDGLLLDKDDYHYQARPPKRTDHGHDYRPTKHVYIISNPHSPKRLKVGIASNLKSRLSSYQTADPDRGFKVEHSVRTPDFRELEKHVHQIRENDGEWVYGTVDEIKQDMANFLRDKG